jgi:hypothetical protein
MENNYQSTEEWQIARENNKRCIDVFMASLPRQLHVVETVKTILANPETLTITIVANNYSDLEWIEVQKRLVNANAEYQVPIYLHRGDNKKEANEKLKFVHKGNGKYISYVDDDLLLSPTHFKYLIEGCEKYNAYVSLHGAILNPLPLFSYYRDRQVFRGLKTVIFDQEVDIASNCGSLFKREFFDEKFYATVYNNAPTVGMDDLLMAVACQQRGIPRYVLKHEEGFMKHKIQYKEDCYVFTKYTQQLGVSDKPQTDYINHYWGSLKK